MKGEAISEAGRFKKPPGTRALRKMIEIEHEATMWGVYKYQITPRLVDRIWGDGLLLIGLGTIHQRPNYHVIRVDSSWHDGSYYAGFTDDLVDHLDEIYLAIEDQFGRTDCDCGECPNYEDEDYSAFDAFPALDTRDGTHWFVLCWPHIKEGVFNLGAANQ